MTGPAIAAKLPFLVTLHEHDAWVPDRFLTAYDLGGESAQTADAASQTVMVDSATGEPFLPHGTLASRYSKAGIGNWNLDLGGVDPALSLYAGYAESAALGGTHRLRRLPAHRREFSRLAVTHLGTRTDVVSAPLMHDTPDELAQPGGLVRDWKRGECDPVPGVTMATTSPIDYVALILLLALVITGIAPTIFVNMLGGGPTSSSVAAGPGIPWSRAPAGASGARSAAPTDRSRGASAIGVAPGP